MDLSKLFKRPWPPEFFIPGCYCCAECVACPDGFSECWELVVAGVTDNGCSTCDTRFNGTFTLEHIAGCAFGTAIEAAYCGGTGTVIKWSFSYSAGTHLWKLNSAFQSVSGVLAEWELDGDTFDCNGTNTFSNLSVVNAAVCSTWPSSLTIEPIAC